MKQQYFLIGLFLLIYNFGYSTYLIQVKDIAPLTGGQAYVLNQTPNPLSLNVQFCAFGVSQPQISTTYTISWYVNSVNSTTGGTLVSSNTVNTLSQINISDVKTFLPATVQEGTFYYYAVLSNPSSSGCGFENTLVSTVQKVDVYKPATYLNFDGINDKVVLQDQSNYAFSNQMAVEFWMNSSVMPELWDPLVTKGDTSWRLQLQEDGTVVFALGDSGDFTAVSSTLVTDGKWHHIAGVFDGSFIKIYVDGDLENQVAFSGTIPNNSSPVWIGSNSDYQDRYYKGDIDELRIWNTVRTTAQINDSKFCELQGNEPGLVSYYKFNQGAAEADNSSVTVVLDATATANNGALSNFDLTGTTSNWLAGSPVGLPPVISVQPQTQAIAETDSFVLTVTATGVVSYQWEVSFDQGVLWSALDDSFIDPDVSGSKTNTLTVSGANMIYINDLIFRVALNGTSMCSIVSNEVKAIITTLDTKSFGINKLKIYPNPSTGIFTIDSKEEVEFSVYDITGKKIINKKSSKDSTNLDLTHFGKGIYMLNVSNNQGEKNTYKLIKK